MIVDIINYYFNNYDGLIMPVGNGYIRKIDEEYSIKDRVEEALDSNLLIGNFGGYPSITLPVSFVNDFPFAVNLTFNRLKDKELLNTAYDLEKIIDFKRGEKNV